MGVRKKVGTRQVEHLLCKPIIMDDYIWTYDDFVEVYTDGACPYNGQYGAYAGIGVWWNHDHPLNISDVVEGDKHSNNVAEIQAAAKAVEVAIDEGITSLQGKEVENRMELEGLDRLCQQLEEIRWNYVPGHSNIIGNDEADRLAREGAGLGW